MGREDTVEVPPAGINLFSFTVRDYQRLHPRDREDGDNRFRGGVPHCGVPPGGRTSFLPWPLSYRLASGQTGELCHAAADHRGSQPWCRRGRHAAGYPRTHGCSLAGPNVGLGSSSPRWRLCFSAYCSISCGRSKRRRGDEDGPSEPIVVDEIAEFDKIPAAALIAEGRIGELYTLVSEAMRRYVGRRFHLDAMEMTHGRAAARLLRGPRIGSRGRGHPHVPPPDASW